MDNSSTINLWEGAVPLFDPAIPQRPPRLTPYLLGGGAARPAVIVCPGGGYMGKAFYEGEPIALWLNRIGASACVLDYRVFPYHHPAPMLDAQRAIRLMRARAAEWGIDPNRIGILGFSAGGHLASTVGTHFDDGDPRAADPIERVSCRPDAQILCYPVITFGQHRHDGSCTALLGENPPADLLTALSNETQVSAYTPPAFLWHSAGDETVPVENSLLFAEALRRHNVPFALHVFTHGPHGGGLADDNPLSLSLWTTLCERWLKEIGFIAPNH
jgi:acetyl esterase/lipase